MFDDGVSIERDWSAVAPRESDGSFQVARVGRWLWQRLLADGRKHYGAFEAAQVHALLADGVAFGWLVDESDPDRVFTIDEFAPSSELARRVADLGARSLPLGDADERKRRGAHENVGHAIAFIVTTPFIFAQEGR